MKTDEELFDAPYWVIDPLPRQVPKDAPGQFFAVEAYYLSKARLARIKRKHLNVILGLNCYYDVSLDGTLNPSPGTIAAAVRKRCALFRIGEAGIFSEPDDRCLTLYEPDGDLLALTRELAAAEGLFVWQPPRAD